MIRMMTTTRTLPALIAGLLAALPVCAATTEGVVLKFSPGRGLNPVVETERISPQNGQRITTGAAEVLEVLLADGTSMTLAPNSEVTINALSYDDAGHGRLALSMNRGLVRIAESALSEPSPIVVKTGSAEVRLDAASAVIEVADGGRTRASMLAGRAVQMTSGGQTQTVERPGFELVSDESQTSLDRPIREPEKAVATDAYTLGTAQLAGLTQQEEDDLGRNGIAELAAVGASTLALATEDRPAGSLTSSGQPGTPAPGGTGGFSEIGAIDGGSGSTGFGVGSVIGAPLISGGEPSASNGLSRSLLQSRDPDVREPRAISSPDGSDAIRDVGPTTNRLYTSGFTETISGPQVPIAAPSIDPGDGLPPVNSTRLQYVFLETDSFSIGLDKTRVNSGFALEVPSQPASNDTNQSWIGDGGFGSGQITGGAFVLPRILGTSGSVASAVVIPDKTGAGQGSIFDTVESGPASA